MGLYFGNNKITGVHFGTVGAGGTAITLSTPTLSLNSNTGVVTATITQSQSGYLTAGSASNTLSLTTQSAATITPTKSAQTAVAAGKYTIGAVTVAAIPSNYIVPSGTLDITTNGTHTVTNYASVSVNVPTQSGSSVSLETATRTYTPTESSQTETITPSSGYDGLSSVGITVNAISSTYVGSGITRRSSTDLSASGATVTVPSGYYASQATKSVAAMTLPTAASNSSSGTSKATITPSTSNKYINIPTGYNSTASYYTISGDADLVASNIKSGVQIFGVTGTYTASGGGIDTSDATATAADLLSGKTAYTGGSKITGTIATKTSSDLTASGATVSVPAGYYATAASKSVATGTAGTPTATKGTVSNHSISVTPSVTNTTGYITGSTKTGTAVIVSASELASGTKSISANGTGIDVVGYAAVDVAVPTGTDTPVFSLTYNSSGNIVSSSCNKTYAECRTILSNENLYADVIVIGPDNSTQTWPAVGFLDITRVIYTCVDASSGEPTVQVLYNSSGITVSDYLIQQLTVDDATTYYGLYGEVAVPAGTAGTPSATKGTVSNHSITVTPSVTNQTGWITGSTKTGTGVTVSASELVSGTYSVTSAGTKDVTNYASASIPAGSATGPSSLSGTSATVSTGTNTLTLTKTGVTTTPTVSAGYVSSATASTATVTLTASVTTKAAATYRASTSAQTIARGTYLTGDQTIAAVSQTNLSAANIKAGTTISISNGQSNIWSVAGTFTSDATATAADINSGATAYVNGSKITGTQTFSTIHTGSSAPSSSLGSNGDVYLVLA